MNKPSSTAEKIQARSEEQQAINAERMADYRQALNAVAATNNGEFVLKAWINALGVFAVKPSRDGAGLVADKALRDFYLTHVRPYLEQELRQKLES